MARPLRIEFPGAIYHVMARGNARQVIFQDDADHQRLLDGLEQTVLRCGWEMFAFVFMPNHVHFFFRTPQANLSRGMQRLLSGYANWYAKKHQQPGHLLQGRFKGELIEDESYFWNVSRYIHLNPTRGKRPLVSHPRDWHWSSYRGYARQRDRLSWMPYDQVYNAWQGERGGGNPEQAYRRFVEAGLTERPANPFLQASHGWLLGGTEFIERIRREMKEPKFSDEVPRSRQLSGLDVEMVLGAVAQHYAVSPDLFSSRGNGHVARAVAAWLARRYTSATLRDLAPLFGLTRPESISNLTRRIDRDLEGNATLRRGIAELEVALQETKNKV